MLKRYWRFALSGTLLIGLWPLARLMQIIAAMIRCGVVDSTAYPKYIIPYAPIALSVLLGVAVMPLMMKRFRRHAAICAGTGAILVFFSSELMLENLIIVDQYPLESWQMFMCYVPRDSIGRMTAAEVLIGSYSPWFKLHFYFIAVVLILSSLTVLYGFGNVIRTGDRTRLPLLAALAVSTALLLGLCIFACFTAFFRDGALTVSPLSASLMALFFLSLGVTAGLYAGTFRPSPALSAATAMAAVLLMYVGEMILLHGHLYRFGTGWFFSGLPGIVLAPADVCVILLTGGVTHLLTRRTL